MRPWTATPRRSPVNTADGGVWASRIAALAASLLLAGQAPAPAEPPDQTQQAAQEVAPQVARRVVWGAQRAALQLKLNQETLIVAASRPGATYLVMAGE